MQLDNYELDYRFLTGNIICIQDGATLDLIYRKSTYLTAPLCNNMMTPGI
jgi:hypothetical protein